MLSSSLVLYVIGFPLASVLFFIIPICVLFFILLDLVIHLFPSLIFAFAFSSVNIFVPFISVMVSHFHVISSGNILIILPWKIFLNLSFQSSFSFICLFIYYLFNGTGIWSCCPDVWWLFVLNQSACSFGQEMFLTKNLTSAVHFESFLKHRGSMLTDAKSSVPGPGQKSVEKISAKQWFLLALGQIISLWNFL